jgi:HK97 family phage portal protein
MTPVSTLNTSAHTSRVLAAWLAGREGAAARAGLSAGAYTAPRAQADNTVVTNLTAQELASLFGAHGLSSAGVAVNQQSALRVAAVYACIDRIAGAIKSLPFNVYERQDSGPREAKHDYHWMFNERASDDWSAADAWSAVIAQKFLGGDGYAELLRPSLSSSRVIGWQPLLQCSPFRDTRTGVKLYRVTRVNGTQEVLDSADVVQLTSPGYDGLTSLSPITYAAQEAVGTSLAGQRWAGSFFKDGAQFDYALQTENSINKEQREAIQLSLTTRAAGSRLPLILANGLKPAQLTINPKDAEILESRKFSVEEICRIFGVPPYMIGHTEKNSSWGAGMEQQGGNFVRYTLMPHLVQIGQEFNHRLWPARARYFVQHDTSALVRGDLKTRFEAYRIALGRAGEKPWMVAEEVRRIEALGDLPEGKSLEALPNTPDTEGGQSAAPSDPAAG